ncbi:MAG TPA: hypothetical protein PKG92_10100 [Anaerolineaceae bacterium]|nr:hypothetical protein [Anaerolineaceae bacterium]
MRTPAGNECSFFYGNYFRGRHEEECRLIGNVPPPKNWKPELCKTCPVPGIQRANACPSMVLDGEITSLLGFRRRIKVNAYCNKSKQIVKEPHVGCGQCHPIPDIFLESKK